MGAPRVVDRSLEGEQDLHMTVMNIVYFWSWPFSWVGAEAFSFCTHRGRILSIRGFLPSLAILPVMFVGMTAQAGIITVDNPSFEILPAGGLPLTRGCGGVPGCAFSIDQIPGWTATGAQTGQFQPGTTPNMFLNNLPDGPTVGYIKWGSISQTVSALAVAGTTYTFNLDVGYRKDETSTIDTVELIVGDNTTDATPSTPPIEGSGDWYVYIAKYTATAGDAGKPITISLTNTFRQGDFRRGHHVEFHCQYAIDLDNLLILGFGWSWASWMAKGRESCHACLTGADLHARTRRSRRPLCWATRRRTGFGE